MVKKQGKSLPLRVRLASCFRGQGRPVGLKAARRISELCMGVTMARDRRRWGEQLYRLGLGDLCEALHLLAGHYLRLKYGSWRYA